MRAMSVEQSSGPSELHRYNAWVTTYLALATAATWVLSIVCILFVEDDVWAIAIAALLLLGAILLTRACLFRAVIVISDASIAALLLGIQTRFIAWRDVKKIVKTRTPIGYGYYADQFQVYPEEHTVICRFFPNLCGNIAFSQDIRRLRQLLDQTNNYAREHKLPLLVWDLEAIANQNPHSVIDTKRKQARSELPVTEF